MVLTKRVETGLYIYSIGKLVVAFSMSNTSFGSASQGRVLASSYPSTKMNLDEEDT